MSETEQKLSKQILMRKNMHSALGILQEAKDRTRVASSLIVRNQGQMDPKLKIVDNILNELKRLQDSISKEFDL